MAPRVLYVVTEDWYFLSHRLPMARAARAAGYEVHVATRLVDGRASIEDEGFTAHEIPWSRGSLSVSDMLATVPALRRLFQSVQPDLIHNVAMKPIVFGSMASTGLPPVVVNGLTGVGSLFIGDSLAGRPLRHGVRFVLGRLLKRNRTSTIVQNPDDLAFVRGLGVPPGSIVLIPGSGVDTERLTPLPDPDGPVTAAYVGRMLADKGVPALIEAVERLAERGAAVRLLLAGDCDAENPTSLTPEALQHLAGTLDIEWLGHVDDVREVWARAHFAVLASRREGLPKSLLEAAACGRAMVATDAPGCREIAIEGETALTVPVDDPDALAAALARMAGDGTMRETFGRCARQLVERRFSSETIGHQTVELYETLIER